MSLELVGSLVALALVDSTSFGTLLIPLLLVLANRGVAWRPMLTYLGTVIVFYFLLGIGLVFGLDIVLSALNDAVSDRTLRFLQLGLGVSLLAGSFFVDQIGRGRHRRSRLAGVTKNPRAMSALALTATAVEAASMFPYLAAIGLLSTVEMSGTASIPILFGYCLVMVLPALVLLGLAGTIGARIWARLERFSSLMERGTSGALGWIVGIAGFFIASDAVSRIWFDDDVVESEAAIGWVTTMIGLG